MNDRSSENNGGAWENRRDGAIKPTAKSTIVKNHQNSSMVDVECVKAVKKFMRRCCHVEQSETSLFSRERYQEKQSEILRFAQNDKQQ